MAQDDTPLPGFTKEAWTQVQAVRQGKSDEMPKGTMSLCFASQRATSNLRFPHHTEFKAKHFAWMVNLSTKDMKPHGGNMKFYDLEGKESLVAWNAALYDGITDSLCAAYDGNLDWFKPENYDIYGRGPEPNSFLLYAKFHVWIEKEKLAEAEEARKVYEAKKQETKQA